MLRIFTIAQHKLGVILLTAVTDSHAYPVDTHLDCIILYSFGDGFGGVLHDRILSMSGG